MENCCPKIVCNFQLNAQKHVGAHVKFAQQMIIAQIGLNAQTYSQKSGCVCVCVRRVDGEGNMARGQAVMQMMRAAPDNT